MAANERRSGILDEVVRAAMERWTIPGLAVGILHANQVQAYGYGLTSLETRQPVTADTLFQIGSISKVFTATVVMILVEEGVLDLDTPVTTYLPELRLTDAEAQRTITLRHLLSHTSGLEGDRFTDYGMGDDALSKAIDEFHTLRQWTPPGELWSYCNSGFYLTGAVIERVTGQPFETVVRERLFEPLGLTRSFFFAHEAIVYPVAVGHTLTEPGGAEHEIARHYPLPRCVNAAGGIIATVGDLLRFAALHLGDGTVDGHRLVSRRSIEAMREPQVAAANFADHYGVGWALHTVAGETVVGHGGSTNGFQAQLWLVPSQGFAVAVLTNSERGSAAYQEIINAVLEHWCGLAPRDPEPVRLSNDALSRFAGRYRRPHSEITVTALEGSLGVDIVRRSPFTGKETNVPRMTLAPIGEHEFVVTDGELKGTTVDFISTETGGVRFVRLGGRLADYVSHTDAQA